MSVKHSRLTEGQPASGCRDAQGILLKQVAPTCKITRTDTLLQLSTGSKERESWQGRSFVTIEAPGMTTGSNKHRYPPTL